MEDDLFNNEARNLRKRTKKPNTKALAKAAARANKLAAAAKKKKDKQNKKNNPPIEPPKKGRPLSAEKQEELNREIVHKLNKQKAVERCPECRNVVIMVTYKVQEHANLRYVTCPKCQRKFALRGLTIRSLKK